MVGMMRMKPAVNAAAMDWDTYHFALNRAEQLEGGHAQPPTDLRRHREDQDASQGRGVQRDKARPCLRACLGSHKSWGRMPAKPCASCARGAMFGRGRKPPRKTCAVAALSPQPPAFLMEDMELDPKCLSLNATARMLHSVRSILAHRWSAGSFWISFCMLERLACLAVPFALGWYTHVLSVHV